MVATEAKPVLQRIAIVDDDAISRETWCETVRTAGFEPIMLLSRFERIGHLVRMIKDNADGALCDQRLAEGNYATFDGATAVARLYDAGIPGILATDFGQLDVDRDIRRHRRKIPSLLRGDEAGEEEVKAAWWKCVRELQGDISPDRKAFRAVVTVKGTVKLNNELLVDAFIPQWNPHEAVRFPAVLVPERLRKHLKRCNTRFIAQVNIGAPRAEDLFLENFTLAPNPDEYNVVA